MQPFSFSDTTLSFLGGVGSSLVATSIAVGASAFRRRLAISKLRGVWVQIRHLNSRNPNNVCFLEVRYSIRKFEYFVEGFVVDEHLVFNSRWSSMNCSVDSRLGRLFYSYSGHHKQTPFSTNHGFGMIEIMPRGRTIGLHDGYFLDAATSSTPVAADYHLVSSHTELEHIKNLADVELSIEKREKPLSNFVRKLLSERS